MNVDDYKVSDEVSEDKQIYFYDHNVRFTVYENSLYDYKIRIEMVDE